MHTIYSSYNTMQTVMYLPISWIPKRDQAIMVTKGTTYDPGFMDSDMMKDKTGKKEERIMRWNEKKMT